MFWRLCRPYVLSAYFLLSSSISSTITCIVKIKDDIQRYVGSIRCKTLFIRHVHSDVLMLHVVVVIYWFEITLILKKKSFSFYLYFTNDRQAYLFTGLYIIICKRHISWHVTKLKSLECSYICPICVFRLQKTNQKGSNKEKLKRPLMYEVEMHYRPYIQTSHIFLMWNHAIKQ